MVALAFVNVLLLRLITLDTSLMLFLASLLITQVRSMSVAIVPQFLLSNFVFSFRSIGLDLMSILILQSCRFLRQSFFPIAPVSKNEYKKSGPLFFRRPGLFLEVLDKGKKAEKLKLKNDIIVNIFPCEDLLINLCYCIIQLILFIE